MRFLVHCQSALSGCVCWAGVAFGVHCGEIDMRCNDHSPRFYNLVVEARVGEDEKEGKREQRHTRPESHCWSSLVEWSGIVSTSTDLGEMERSSKY